MSKITEPTHVLHTLRQLVPERRLNFSESLWLGELQASRLLELFHVPGPYVSSALVRDLPRIHVTADEDLPVSGAAHWQNGRWVITLNPSEPEVRQRFSLMHEFKHCLDHHASERLYGDPANDPQAAQRAERAADHFAACLLMPKRWLKRAWVESGQDLGALAAQLGVSTRALSLRLWHLGLGVERQRCPGPSVPAQFKRFTYLRLTPQVEVVR